MAITVRKATEENALMVRNLLLDWWKHQWKYGWDVETAERYFWWRYNDRPNGETLLGYDRGQCVAVLDSFLRRYQVQGRYTIIRETCDWFCLPEYRKVGLGVHLMRRMMSQPEPILSVAGSAQTLELLPRLGWSRLDDVASFFLPLSLRVAAALAVPQLRCGGAGLLRRSIPAFPLRFSLRQTKLPGDTQIRLRQHEEEMPFATDDYTYTLTPVMEPTVLDWLARAPNEVGEIMELSFYSGRQFIGLAICRIRALFFGTIAYILHLHSLRSGLLDRILSGTVGYLRGLDVGIILCRTSCPQTDNALRKIGFLRRKPVPAYWWSRDGSVPARPTNLTFLRADDAFNM